MVSSRFAPGPRSFGFSLLAAFSSGCAHGSPAPGAPSPFTEEDGTQGKIDAPEIRAHEATFAGSKQPDGGAAYESWSYRASGGAGDVFYTRVWPARPGPPRCPFPTPEPEVCGLLTMKPRGGAATSPAPAPHDWTIVHAGREGFYARRREARFVDFISPRGAVGSLVEEARLESVGPLSVVELPTRVFFVGQSGRGQHLMELRRPAGQPASLSEPIELPMVEASNAQQARWILSADKRPMYGAPVVVPLAGETWAMVWIEVFAPKRGTPRKAGGKNGCGSRRPSRSLSDPSVVKHVNVTRFSGTTITGEEQAFSDDDIDLAKQELVAHAEGDRVVASMGRRARPAELAE